jgi:hypothetical protein
MSSKFLATQILTKIEPTKLTTYVQLREAQHKILLVPKITRWLVARQTLELQLQVLQSDCDNMSPNATAIGLVMGLSAICISTTRHATACSPT